ncbi:L-serine dehydratase [Pseudobutyrivibrio sp. NOR37]|uniref:L-serine dehydratase n=1 Tax=Pseudobutyrivibrio xylanivorans TaxID=185007 RepID=A0A6M0LKB7_PSEXY|nr:MULTISPECIES: L-serine ammonia-lyase, iron-sulfur-dependent, subunit alpha [Pseudobutyrivibrio]NEX02600.1 L-serine ammonia-lyase, iron-sulfur-dependent, subunit alpha [Pseudobutyrivibrio xylanivorans]SFR82174.1 L-serine dehydratase [Pseudobutyrivibrio sp. NOR37]
MDFKKAVEMLALCDSKNLTISQVMKQRECHVFETTEEEIIARMEHAWQIMKDSSKEPTTKAMKSMGGLIGGEAKKLTDHRLDQKSILGDVVNKAIAYSMAVLEVNTSMGLIVASPTAGSAGVLPGVMLALQEEYDIPDDRIIDGLFNASAIGYLAMQNATIAGAVGGCQAEIGVAAAMAASAATELMGGTPLQCTYAASTVLMNMLGLICDPVLGLVEYPCQNRNASGAANALIAAEMALAGITQMIPLDEMLECMYNVGKRLPVEFRETAKGGCATTPTACALCKSKQ